MLLSKIDPDSLSEEKIEHILYDIPRDDGAIGDCIFCFGCKTRMKERVELAVKLYKEGRAPYILFSGGLGKTGKVKEAIVMAEMAISMGVPPEAIIQESESNNTIENILCSLVVLERKFLLQNIKRLIVVSTEPYIQRTILTLKRYMPNWIEYSYCYDTNCDISKNNWKKTKETRECIKKEAKGIIFYAANGYNDDKEISL